MPITTEDCFDSHWPSLRTIGDTNLDRLASLYQGAEPFPHLVIDDFFSADLIEEIRNGFDAAPAQAWRDFSGALQRKRGTLPGVDLPSPIQRYFDFIYSGPFLRLLTRLTGIADLIPDPALHGGGMHEVTGGGLFDVHVDFATHPCTGLTNRLAVITYLNRDWRDADGGALELWRAAPAERVAVIAPVAGRTVILEQSARAAHGHPGAVAPGQCRRSVIAYFYTNDRHAAAGANELATEYIAHAGQTILQKAELLTRRFVPALVRLAKAIRPGDNTHN